MSKFDPFSISIDPFSISIDCSSNDLFSTCKDSIIDNITYHIDREAAREIWNKVQEYHEQDVWAQKLNEKNLAIARNKKLRNKIKRVEFNKPWTIVIWNDGTVTRCKCQKGDKFNKETGLAICIAKKFYAENENIYHEMVRKWC